MLGSLIRLAVFLGIVVGLTWGIAELNALDGGVTIALAGYEHALSPLAFAVLIVAVAGGLVLLVRLCDLALTALLFLLRDPKAIARLTGTRRQRRALDAVSSGLVAIAGGDTRAAQLRLADVQRLSDRPGLNRLLGAMAAEAAGDRAKAKAQYRSLAEDPETMLAGIRGQLELALSAGDAAQARDLAERAAKLRPDDRDLLETLFELQRAGRAWQAARGTLKRLRKLKAVSTRDADRREAALALALAREAEAVGDRDTGRALATEAAALDPANPHAAAAAARHLIQDGEKAAATAMIVSAWARTPDAALATAFAEMEPDESPEARWTRFEPLFAANPGHRETCYLKAELALVSRQWQAARRAIETLREPDLSARACAIMAAVARGEGQREAVVRAWLARALSAPRPDGPDREIGQAAMLPLLVEDDVEPQADPGAPRTPPRPTRQDVETFREGERM